MSNHLAAAPDSTSDLACFSILDVAAPLARARLRGLDVELSVWRHMEAGTVLQGRELPSVMAAACKALEGAMNIEATALGVAGLLEELTD